MHEQAWKERRVRQTDRLPPVLAMVFYNVASPWRAERSVWDLTEKRALRDRDREVARMPVGMRYELVDVTQHAGKPLSQDNIVELMISTELLGKDLEPAAVQSILEAQDRLLGSRDQRKVLELLRGWTRLTIARTGVDLDVLEDTETMQEMQESGRMLTYIEACAQEYRAKLRAEGGAEARAEGLQDQRVGLCRRAQREFGAAAATDLAKRIEGINDSAQLWEIGDLIIDCSDAGEFGATLREIG
ncbi:MAG: Rpn family recombination-promoting nuclease/putative transposase [Bryobacterales bacterium]|nr:Rpn family recombination-promoting nuclease/putative transposase [Bryobacterales bacterium]